MFAAVLASSAAMLTAQAVWACNSVTPQETGQGGVLLHWPTGVNENVCQDGNYNQGTSNYHDLEEIVMPRWYGIAAGVPRFTIGSWCQWGEYWFQGTSACAASSPNWVGCANLTYSVSDGTMAYFDLTINSNENWSDHFYNVLAYDLPTALAHETGHVNGLDHNYGDPSESVMVDLQGTEPYTNSVPGCADVARIHTIYGY
jgi:hypothetical protein